MQSAVFHIRGSPHLFDVVKLPDFRTEYMDDNIAGVDQHPVAGLQTFDAGIAEPIFLDIGDEVVGNGADMAARSPGDNDHVVSQRRFSGNVDGYNVFALGIFETAKDRLKSPGGGISATFLAPGEAAGSSSLAMYCCQSFSFLAK